MALPDPQSYREGIEGYYKAGPYTKSKRAFSDVMKFYQRTLGMKDELETLEEMRRLYNPQYSMSPAVPQAGVLAPETLTDLETYAQDPSKFEDIQKDIKKKYTARSKALEELDELGLGQPVPPIVGEEDWKRMAKRDKYKLPDQIRMVPAPVGTPDDEIEFQRNLKEGAPSRTGKSIAGTVMKYLEAGSRPISAAHAGAVRAARSIGLGESAIPEEVKVEPGILAGDIDARMLMGDAGMFMPDIGTIKSEDIQSNLPVMVEGIPIAQAIKDVAGNPKLMGEVLNGAYDAASRVFWNDDPDTADDWANYLKSLQGEYRERADAQAEKTGEDPESIYQALLTADLGESAIEHPDAAQFMHDMIFDVYNIVTPVKVAKGLASVAQSTRAGAKAIEAGGKAVRKVTKYGRYMSELDPLQDLALKGNKNAGELRTLLRNVPAEARATAAKAKSIDPSGVSAKNIEHIERMRLISKHTSHRGFGVVDDVPSDPKVVAKLLAQKQNETGVPWIDLDSHLSRMLNEADVGGRGRMLVPEFMKETLENHWEDFIDYRMPSSTVKRAVKMARDEVIDPINSMARSAMTVINPTYAVRNAMSGVPFAYQAHGAKAMNPAYQKTVSELTALSMAKPGGKIWNSLAKKTVKTKTGELTYEEAIDTFRRSGVLGQFKEKFAEDAVRDLSGRGPLAQAARGMKWGTEKLRARAVAEASENFQHVSVGLGFLDETSDLGIAKLGELHAKYGGDLARMSRVEEKLAKDAFAFYGFMRWSVGYELGQLFENPARLATFVKNRRRIERERGTTVPVGGEALPSWMDGLGLPPEPHMQVGLIREYLDKGGEIPDPRSEQFVINTIEDPVSMLVGTVSQMIKATGGDLDSDEDIHQMLSPATQLLRKMGSKELRKGRPAHEVPYTHMKQYFRFPKIYKDIKDLASENPTTDKNKAALRIMNYFGPGALPWRKELGFPEAGITDVPPFAAARMVHPGLDYANKSAAGAEKLKDNQFLIQEGVGDLLDTQIMEMFDNEQ